MLCDEPLRLALRNRHIDVAKTLLEAGANPNKRYFFGSEINLVSPLDIDCMELLLAFGAQPNTRDRAGLTPLMKAARLPQVFYFFFYIKIYVSFFLLYPLVFLFFFNCFFKHLTINETIY